MALNTNTFRTRRYLRTKFKEGRYLLASEASDLQLESLDLMREFIKLSYGNFAVGKAFQPEQTASDELTIRPGYAWVDGVPFLLKSGTDSKVILGVVPTGAALSEASKTTSDDGGKVLDVSGLANGNYSIVCEAFEELVKPSGTGAVDTNLQGVNVDEETANKARLMYKLHVVETNSLNSSPTFPISGPHYVNEIVVTPTGGANFVVTANDISQDVNGADRQVIFDNAADNLPYGSAAAEYINGLLIDSDGNEMVITSITTTDGGATVRFLLDREVDYNSSNPKAGWPVITTNVPYKLVKADFYVTSTSGIPLGRHYWRIADFTMSGGVVTAVTDQRVVTEVNSFETDHNLALIGGGDISWDLGSDEFSFTDDLLVTIPGVAGRATIEAASSPIIIPANGNVAYVLLDRYAATDYSVTPVIVNKSDVPNNVNVYIVLERFDDRVLVAGNTSIGDQDTTTVGNSVDPRFAGHNHDGSNGESSDIEPTSILFTAGLGYRIDMSGNHLRFTPNPSSPDEYVQFSAANSNPNMLIHEEGGCELRVFDSSIAAPKASLQLYADTEQWEIAGLKSGTRIDISRNGSIILRIEDQLSASSEQVVTIQPGRFNSTSGLGLASQIHHKNIARCGGVVNTWNGSTPTIISGFNIASVGAVVVKGRLVGAINVQFTNALPNANYVVFAMQRSSIGASPRICRTLGGSTTGFSMQLTDGGGSGLDGEIQFMVYEM